jgi:hypothetical protein
VRVENCPTCASALEAALRQRLSAVDISVSLEAPDCRSGVPAQQSVCSVSFREAVKEGGADVQRVDIEACGTIDTADGQSWIKSGTCGACCSTDQGRSSPAQSVCVTGELQDQVRPPRLVPGKRVKLALVNALDSLKYGDLPPFHSTSARFF